MHPKTLLAVVAMAASSLAVGSRLAAQDVTVLPLEWVHTQDAPDELPVARGALRPSFPYDLRKTPEFGYVVADLYTDEKGERLSHHLFSTLAAYEEAVREETREWKLKPARRAGHPVNSYVFCTVVFNPASANPKKPDATARLIEPRLVADPSIVTPPGATPAPPEVIWAMVALDATGHPTEVTDAPEGKKALLEESLRRWRFAPARHDGVAIASQVRVPFILVRPIKARTAVLVPPKAIKRVMPDVPYALRRSGLRADILMDFNVDVDGKVVDAFVSRSINPEFDQPALEAIYKWRFEPASRDGVPIKAHMQTTLTMRHPDQADGGDSGLTVRPPPDQSKLPEEFRYDVGPKPRGTVVPVYPYALMAEEVRGKARVRFAVEVEGHVMFTGVESADRPEMGAALCAAIECYEFDPALKAGHPSQALMGMERKFSLYDSDGLVSREDRALLALERKHPEEIYAADRLDAKLKPTSTRPPVFPIALSTPGAKGNAVVELLIDREGRARLPRVVSASEPAFGWAAVQAVSVWRFDPPKSAGKPVVVRVRVPFNFSGPPAPAKSS